MNKEKIKIKDFWWMNNTSCWFIQREGLVDMYLYVPTGRYIYQSSITKQWIGTTYPHPTIGLPQETADKCHKKLKYFENEDVAVRWMTGEKVKYSEQITKAE